MSEPKDRPHPAEVNFDAWCAEWLRKRVELARKRGEPIPSEADLASEMVQAIRDGKTEP